MVETGLAIGVSAVLIILTIGLGSMVSRRRFQDSLTSAQAFIQTQYNEVRSGINARLGGAASSILGCGSNAAGNSENCYTVGRLLTFSNDSAGNGVIKSSYVVAVKPTLSGPDADNAWPNSEKSGLQNLKDAKLYAIVGDSSDGGLAPTTKELGGDVIKYVWNVSGNTASTGSLNNINIAMLRSPLDGSLIVASNVQMADESGYKRLTLVDNSSTGSSTNMGTDRMVALGIANGGIGQSGGLICIAGGDNSAGVSNNNNVNLGSLFNNARLVAESCRNQE